MLWVINVVERVRMGRSEVRCASVKGGGLGGCGGRLGRRKTETRVCLFTATGGFIKNGAVDFGDNDVVAAVGIKRGVRRLGESVEF